MECEICLEKFDHSINKPLVLFRCGHTLCSKCVDSLHEKKCHSCSDPIEDIRPNWAVLKTTPESEYDKMKADLLKSLTEIELLEKNIQNTEQNNSSDLIKQLKKQVEYRSNELIKHINANKRQLFKEIETKFRLQEQILDSSLLQTKEKKEELKQKLNENKYDKQQLIDLRPELTSHLSKLSLKEKRIAECEDSFELTVNEKIRFEENLIGEIKKKKINRLKHVPVPMTQKSCPKIINRNAQKILIASGDAIKLLDLSTAACLKIFEDNANVVTSVKLLNQNKIVTCFIDKSIKIWDLSTGNCQKTFLGHSQAVWCIAIISNERIASCSQDCSVRVWEVESGQCSKILNGHTCAVTRIAKLSNENLLSVSLDKTIKLWNLYSGKCLRTFKGHLQGVECVEILSREKILSGSWDNTIKVWNAVSGDCLQTLEGHTDGVNGIQVLSNEMIISGSADKTIRIWCLTTNSCIQTINGHLDSVTGIQVLSNEKLASCSNDKTIKIWDLASGGCLKTIHSEDFISSIDAF